jgi:hypothetical protein
MKQRFKGKKRQSIVVGKYLGKCQSPKKEKWRELKIVANMGLHINGGESYNYFTRT